MGAARHPRAAALVRLLLAVGEQAADGVAMAFPGLERLQHGPEQLLGLGGVVAAAAQLGDDVALVRDAIRRDRSRRFPG